jgi:hypothetical protein
VSALAVSVRGACGVMAAVLLAGCRPGAPLGDPAAPLPAIPVYEITPNADSGGVVIARVPGRDPLGALGATRRVTLTANNAEARTLLLWLAQEAGVSIVVSPDVTARVSVHFADVAAVDAMRAILAEARLSVLSSGMNPPWPPVVFHQVPVNINESSAESIAARFGVSAEMARWIVESRARP